jgi:hypothetical protein
MDHDATAAPTSTSDGARRARMLRTGLLCAFSMALGWRIRGQFGHEIGAALAGALGAMALALFSGREDWRRRIHYFALFGALGWAFGRRWRFWQSVLCCG